MPMKTTNLRGIKDRGGKQGKGDTTEQESQQNGENTGEINRGKYGFTKMRRAGGVIIGSYGAPIEISLNTIQNSSFTGYLVWREGKKRKTLDWRKPKSFQVRLHLTHIFPTVHSSAFPHIRGDLFLRSTLFTGSIGELKISACPKFANIHK